MGLHGRTTEEGAKHLIAVRARIAEALGSAPEWARHDLGFSARSDPAFPLGASVDVSLSKGPRHRWVFECGWSSCGGSPAVMVAQAVTIRDLAVRACVGETIAGEHRAEWSEVEVRAARKQLQAEDKLRAEALESAAASE